MNATQIETKVNETTPPPGAPAQNDGAVEGLIDYFVGMAKVHMRTGLRIAEESVDGAGDLLHEVSKGLGALRKGLAGERAAGAERDEIKKEVEQAS